MDGVAPSLSRIYREFDGVIVEDLNNVVQGLFAHGVVQVRALREVARHRCDSDFGSSGDSAHGHVWPFVHKQLSSCGDDGVSVVGGVLSHV